MDNKAHCFKCEWSFSKNSTKFYYQYYMLLILSSLVTGCVSMSTLFPLIGNPPSFPNSAVVIKICVGTTIIIKIWVND